MINKAVVIDKQMLTSLGNITDLFEALPEFRTLSEYGQALSLRLSFAIFRRKHLIDLIHFSFGFSIYLCGQFVIFKHKCLQILCLSSS